MAIQYALDRYKRGEIKVNAVHEMMEHMSRQMDTLRQILRVQEDKMSKAGILVESHADILDRMFWAEIPEAGKKSVLLSSEAACVPPRNIRSSSNFCSSARISTLPPKSFPTTVTASRRRMSNRAVRRLSVWLKLPTCTLPCRSM